MATRHIVVDDNSAGQIHYTGSWSSTTGEKSQYGNSRPFQNTLHTTVDAASSFSFSFTGSSIRVYASIFTGTFPTWECYVDGIKLASNKPGSQQNNFAICHQDTIRDGSHEITVNVTKSGAGFWFDNLIYAPPSNVSFESATLRVNRFDRGIVYGSGWSSLGGFANFTQEAGSILKFDFFGSSLSWTGCIPKQLAIAPSFGTYSVDGAPPTSFQLGGLPTHNTSTLYNQIFFTTPEYPVGPHTLLVTHGGNKDQTPLTLNFLDIFDASSGSLTTPPNISPSPLVTQSPAPHQRSLATGTIIGVVVGVICTAVFILIVALLCRRRAHYSPRDDILPTQVRSTTDITPFPSAPVLRPIETSEIRISKSFSSPSIGDHSPVESYQTFNDDATEPALLSAVDMHREQISPNHKPLPVRFYQDSGVRMSPVSRDFVDVPPSYTPR